MKDKKITNVPALNVTNATIVVNHLAHLIIWKHTFIHTVHVGNKVFKCDICDRDFKEVAVLKQHMSYDHKKNPKSSNVIVNNVQNSSLEPKLLEIISLMCMKNVNWSAIPVEICLLQRNHWTSTKKTVQEGHKDYKCDTCGKSYSQAHNLRNHIRIVHDHERHKDYKCDSCGKLYSYNGLLKHHIHVVHDGRKDHKCEPCAKSLT